MRESLLRKFLGQTYLFVDDDNVTQHDFCSG